MLQFGDIMNWKGPCFHRTYIRSRRQALSILIREKSTTKTKE